MCTSAICSALLLRSFTASVDLNLFIYAFVDGHLDCCHFLVVVFVQAFRILVLQAGIEPRPQECKVQGSESAKSSQHYTARELPATF